MAHFAEIDKNNVVIRVLVTDNNDVNEDEGYSFLVNTFGGKWIKTSYNTIAGKHLNDGTPLHKNFAAIGYLWDGVGFYEPQPFPSWIFDSTTYTWKAPVDKPKNVFVAWSEEQLIWIEAN